MVPPLKKGGEGNPRRVADTFTVGTILGAASLVFKGAGFSSFFSKLTPLG